MTLSCCSFSVSCLGMEKIDKFIFKVTSLLIGHHACILGWIDCSAKSTWPVGAGEHSEHQIPRRSSRRYALGHVDIDRKPSRSQQTVVDMTCQDYMWGPQPRGGGVQLACKSDARHGRRTVACSCTVLEHTARRVCDRA